MQLKVTTDYAVRTLMYLARHKGIVPIAEIAEAMKIPEKYLNRLGLALRDEGLIVTHRGKNGGYSLGRPPENIRLYDVVALVEGTVALNRCLEEDGYCGRDAAGFCTVIQVLLSDAEEVGELLTRRNYGKPAGGHERGGDRETD